jgi:hypothetical protein
MMANSAADSTANWETKAQQEIEQKAEQIARLLPSLLRRTQAPARSDPLSVLLGAMALLQLGPETVLEKLDSFFDPERALLDSLVFLAFWVDLEPLIAPGQPLGLAWRRLVGTAVPLLKQRSTRRGLRAFLETATGIPGFQVLESPERPFHIQVLYPAGAKPDVVAFVRRIVEYQKPAYLTYELVPSAGTESE